MMATNDIQWFGNSDNHTSVHTFFYQGDGIADVHVSQFAAVCAVLDELCRERDQNGDPIAELIAKREVARIHFIAYRFTSDWAYRHYHSQLVRLGGSLGHGGFEPWRADRSDYLFYLAEDAPHEQERTEDQVIRDPAERACDSFRVLFEGRMTSTHFNSKGAASAYLDMLKGGQRKPEY